MNCPEKENLQHRCAASWTEFESALDSLGVKLDPAVGDLRERLLFGFSRPGARRAFIDPETRSLLPPYREAFALLTEYRKSSSALQEHLHAHRC